MCSPLIDNSDDASLGEMKKVHSTALIALLLDFPKIFSPNTGILIPLLYYQNIKNLVFSFRVDLHLCLGIVEL